MSIEPTSRKDAPWWKRWTRTAPAHYSTAELRDYLSNDWDAPREAQLSAHLARCPDCSIEIKRLAVELETSGDPFLPTAPAPDELPPGTRVERYVIEEASQHGGQGVVYKARHDRMRHSVALKFLRGTSEQPEAALNRFEDEATTHARLHHPNIVPVYDFFEWDGRPCLVLEYMSGGSLKDQVNRQPVAPRDAARLVIALAQAIHYAHGQGVVHRDLKPANVLLDEHRTPRVSDFGLAWNRDGGPRLTRAGAGTIQYMSPEQVRALEAKIGPRTDVYGLSAILYELLAGRPPFAGLQDKGAILHHIRTLPPEPLRTRGPGAVAPDLAAICFKGLAKEPKGRYATAADFAADLQRYLEGKPTNAHPPGPPRRLLMWALREQPAAAAVGLLLLLIGVLVGASVGIRQSRDEALISRNNEQTLRQRTTSVISSLAHHSAWSETNLEAQRELNASLGPVLEHLRTGDDLGEVVRIESTLLALEGISALGEKRFDQAEKNFRTVIAGASEIRDAAARQQLPAGARAGLVRVLAQSGRLPEAVVEQDQLLDMLRDTIATADTSADKAVSRIVLRSGYALAEALADHENLEDLVRCYDKLVDVMVPRPMTDFSTARERCELLFARANARFKGGKRAEAVEDIDRALQVALPWRDRDPQDRDTTTLLWRCYANRAYYQSLLDSKTVGPDLEQARKLLPTVDVTAWPAEDAMLAMSEWVANTLSISATRVLDPLQRLELTDRRKGEYISLRATLCVALAMCEYRDGMELAGSAWEARFRQLREQVKARADGSALLNALNRQAPSLEVARALPLKLRWLLLEHAAASTFPRGADRYISLAKLTLENSKKANPVWRRAHVVHALNLLEAAYIDGFTDVVRLESDGELSSLHEEPRYQELVKRLEARGQQTPGR